jgi:hypothetical protein
MDVDALGRSAPDLSAALADHKVAATPMTAWGERVAPRYIRFVYSRNRSNPSPSLDKRPRQPARPGSCRAIGQLPNQGASSNDVMHRIERDLNLEDSGSKSSQALPARRQPVQPSHQPLAINHAAQHSHQPPAFARAITLDRVPPALLSTRNRLRTAVRRGAAWPPVERPSSCLVVQQAVSRWQEDRPTEPSCLPSAARADYNNTVWRPGGVVLPRVSGCPPRLGHPVHVLGQRRPVQRPPIQCPASGACPASTGPGSARPVSGVRCPMPGVAVRCPVARVDVGCPVRASGIRACRVCVRSVRTGEFMEREDAMGSHTPRDRPGRHVTTPRPRPARRPPNGT